MGQIRDRGLFHRNEHGGRKKFFLRSRERISYLHCGDTELTAPHIVASPRDCLQTYYKYNSSNVKRGGYAASLMPANLETEAKKFTTKLQGYMTTIRRLENNKGTWAWASSRIFLPGNPELVGFSRLHGYVGRRRVQSVSAFCRRKRAFTERRRI